MIDLTQFVGNPEVYAEQNADGSYTPVHEPLDEAVLQSHVRKLRSVGTYVVWYDKARMMVWDIDDRDLTLAKDIAHVAEQHGFLPGIEFSGRKGYHVWVTLDEWMDAGQVQRAAKAIAAEAGFNGEVFPKQGVARNLGSLVKLPLGRHAVSGEESRFLQVPGKTPAKLVRQLVTSLPEPVVVQRTSGTGPLFCVDSIQNDKPKPGQRNELWFHFACHLRRMGLHAEAVEAVLTELYIDADPGEIGTIVTNSEFSGPRCDALPPDRHCPPGGCIKDKAKGLSTRPGQLKRGMPGELVVVKLGEHASNKVVFLDHPDIETGGVELRSDDGN